MAEQLWVCEICGRAGEISTFNDDCRPGWTHGRLIKVTSGAVATTSDELRNVQAAVWGALQVFNSRPELARFILRHALPDDYRPVGA